MRKRTTMIRESWDVFAKRVLVVYKYLREYVPKSKEPRPLLPSVDAHVLETIHIVLNVI